MAGTGKNITMRVTERYICNSFESYQSMKLSEEVLKCILGKGINQPSLPEKRGIDPMALGQNVIHQADSSYARRKTMCYGVLGRLDYKSADCQVLILAFNEKSAKEIKELFLDLGESLHVKVGGGMDSGDEDQTDFHVFVGTPSNVLPMLKNKKESRNFRGIISFVLDDADKMIRPDFKSDSENEICNIFRLLPYKTQVVIFFSSYNMSLELLRFARELMVEDTTYLISRKDGVTFEDVDIVGSQLTCGKACHLHIDVKHDDKMKYLQDLLKRQSELAGNISDDSHLRKRSIIYVNIESFDELRNEFDDNKLVSFFQKRTKNCMETLEEYKKKHQEMIEEYKNKLNNGDSLMLITTASVREILQDMHNVFVINYDLPTLPSEYIRRIGYCENHTFEVINLITEKNDMEFFKIQDYYNLVINCIPPSLEKELFGDKSSKHTM